MGVSADNPDLKVLFRNNNLDLIRLLAALQVAVLHSVGHLGLPTDSVFAQVMALIPGVPVFFFVSGFLISRSYETNSILKEYSYNRAMRIYPALIVCTIVALLSVVLSGYFRGRDLPLVQFIIWLAGQVTIVQFYNPGFMREYGTGVLNGSLWTITVELQFYVIIPILYTLLKGATASRRRQDQILVILAIFFMVINVAYHQLDAAYGRSFIHRLLGVTFVPWVYMFIVGILFQRHFATIHRLLAGKFLLLAGLYLAIVIPTKLYFNISLSNSISPPWFLLVSVAVFALAYSYTSLAHKLLKRHDLSYGIYVYHIPVINFLLWFGLAKEYRYLGLVLLCTILLAAASWWLVERPAIKLKRHPLMPVTPEPASPKA